MSSDSWEARNGWRWEAPLQPLALRKGKPELLAAVEAPSPPALLLRPETLRLLQRHSCGAGIPKLACLPSCLQGVEDQVTRGLSVAECPWFVSHPQVGVV